MPFSLYIFILSLTMGSWIMLVMNFDLFLAHLYGIPLKVLTYFVCIYILPALMIVSRKLFKFKFKILTTPSFEILLIASLVLEAFYEYLFYSNYTALTNFISLILAVLVAIDLYYNIRWRVNTIVTKPISDFLFCAAIQILLWVAFLPYLKVKSPHYYWEMVYYMYLFIVVSYILIAYMWIIKYEKGIEVKLLFLSNTVLFIYFAYLHMSGIINPCGYKGECLKPINVIIDYFTSVF